MTPTENLYYLAKREGIVVEFLDLPDDFAGLYMYVHPMTRPHIGISKSLLARERVKRCVLAHELGHHFTTTGNIVAASTLTGNYHICKFERIANEWAVNQMVPGDTFLELVAEKYSFDEIADYFFVVPEFIIYRARTLARNGLRCRAINGLINETQPDGAAHEAASSI